MPRLKADAVVGNEEAVGVVAQTPGLLQWVVVNPLQPRTYEQAERMLKSPKCVGIKIHPEEHGYPIREHGDAIFKFAATHQAVVLTHSGERNSVPEDFVPFANEYPAAKLILAHIGCGWDVDPTHQVRAIQQSRHGNVFADTSSAQSILPCLIEFAVREVGAERVLYGTDTPLYFAPMQRVRINLAEITDADKRLILRDNAVRLLKLTAAHFPEPA
jgi:predicted TIM-barrel fold metal-dependent hydrolase